MRAALFAIALCWFGYAHAGSTFEWSADADSGAVADDNWLFNEDEIASVGIEASLQGTASLVAPTSELALDGKVLKTDFESNELPDAEEYLVSMRASHEYSLGRSQASVGYRSRDTLLSVQNTDAFAAANEKERTSWFAVETTRELGPRTTLSLDASGSRVRYASPTPDRNDFDFGTVGIGANYQIAPTLVGSARLLMDAYETEEAPILIRGQQIGTERQKAFSIGPSLGFAWEAAERYELTGEISVRRRENSSELTFALPGLPRFSSSTQDDDPEYLGALGISRTFDLGVVRARIHRNLVPSSLGRLRTRDTANFYASRELSADASISIGASIASEEEETSVASNRLVALTTTRWVNAEVSYAHRLGPNVAVTATYRYRSQNSEDVESIEGNGVSVTLRYQMGNRR